jgi:hypothetical protein
MDISSHQILGAAMDYENLDQNTSSYLLILVSAWVMVLRKVWWLINNVCIGVIRE